ncbi:MAG: DUF2791 family P-loop domain-containing protein [Myxococcales bacterium]|nr:DUF2791 family P-loop domain-containing protein [Myxococcales bacterium]
MARRKSSSAQIEAALAAAEQGLLDLAAAEAADVVFVREHDVGPSSFFDPLEARALELGFAVSSVVVGVDHGFEALDDVVRGFVRNLRASDTEEKGITALLEAFADKRGKRVLERFDEAAESAELGGDVAIVARSFLAAAKEGRREARLVRGFFEGADVAADLDGASGVFSARTAKRALAQITRLVRALGYEGTLLITRRAGALAELSPARREGAYTVLRELIDNAEGTRGMIASRLYVSGGDELFAGSHALGENRPLATRVLWGAGDADEDEEPRDPLPHAPVLHLEARDGEEPRVGVRVPEKPTAARVKAVRALVRVSAGLPPGELLTKLTVGYEAVDEVLDKLFETASNAGSVFSLLSGAYGSGKTHLLLHVTARALADKRPVLRLGVERLDADLGNPQRHFRRLVEGAMLPGAGAPSLLDRLAAWRRSDALARKLARALEEIAESEADAAPAAKRALRASTSEEPHALEACLLGLDLEARTNGASYRYDAYARLLLWLELCERLDGTAGPVLLIDEAENLYKAGTSRPERRTALRSLAFYCGGALPRACVILAVTPETLEMLREEAADMLAEVTEQRTLLAWEDVTMLRRRLLRAKPIEVAKLGKAHLAELAGRAREIGVAARGAVRDPDWDDFVEGVVSGRPSARRVVRAAVTRTESLWWLGR